MKTSIVLFALLLLLGKHTSFAADELRLVIAPKSAVLTAKGFVEFDAFIYNGTQEQVKIPWLQRAYTVVWKLHDVSETRPDRDQTSSVVGTDTAETTILKPGTAKKCALGAQFNSEPNDVLEFYITIERKAKAGAVETLRSNSVIMYRPKVENR